jgi:3-hydroxyisobutyrate dehydrogenase-like beta-hydroxyacid dehydrogenase
MNVTFVGLGNMGTAMANRLLETGVTLTVWNRTAVKAERFAERGAVVAPTPAAAVTGADVVLSSLMDDASVEELFGLGGPAFAAMRSGAIHLSLTTISPGCADHLQMAHKQQGIQLLSGPVVGRPQAAASGALLQYLSGDATAMARVEPLCAAFAKHVVRLPGSAGTANRQKLCANFFVIAVIEAIGEALAFAERSGAVPAVLSGLMQQSFAAPGFTGYVKRMQARETSSKDGFSLRAGRKDLQLILDEAHRSGCPLELADLVADKMRAASARGMDDCDWSVIAEMNRMQEGVR